MPTCGSPRLIAAYRVLHRQSVPWHPPCALIRLILPNFCQTLLRLLRGPTKAILSIVVVFLTLFLCSFQGAIEVFVLISYGVESRNFKTIQKLFSKHNLISYPTFRRLFAGLPPALLPVEAFYLPISFLAITVVPTLEVESPIRRLVSP